MYSYISETPHILKDPLSHTASRLRASVRLHPKDAGWARRSHFLSWWRRGVWCKTVMCAHTCEWVWGCNCMALTHAAALLSSLGACHHMIPLQSTSFIPNSFPTMPGVSLSAFHHHNEVCLLFFCFIPGIRFSL